VEMEGDEPNNITSLDPRVRVKDRSHEDR